MKYILVLFIFLSGCSQSNIDFLNQPLNTGDKECISVSYRNGLVWRNITYEHDISLHELNKKLNYPNDIRKTFIYC